jgi:hypothetical protein
MRVKTCFGIMVKIDFNKIQNILECAIRNIFSALN